MLFYSEKENEHGELDFFDTNDFQDVFFEKERFVYIEDGVTKTATVECKLHYDESENMVSLCSVIDAGERTYTHYVEIIPQELIDEGVEVFRGDKLLDDAPLIKKGKQECLAVVKDRMLSEGLYLKGTELDVMGFIKSKKDVIGIIDCITITNETTILAAKHYSIASLANVSNATLEILLPASRKISGTISSIAVDDSGILTLSLTHMESKECEEALEYKNAHQFATMEEYQTDRARFISVATDNIEEEFDEFDDLF